MTKWHLLAIGNAIVDVLTRVEEDFLQKNRITKGAMHLINSEQAEIIYEKMGQALEVSGGSAANSAAAFANLGGKVAFTGKIAKDQLGQIFKHDLKACGVDFIMKSKEETSHPATGRCMVFTTPDGERTMQTYLGAAHNLSKEDLDPQAVSNADILYFEGYLWDSQTARAAIVHAIECAKRSQKECAFSLSDPFCVERYQNDFLKLIQEKSISILFANEQEIKALYGEKDLQKTLEILQKDIGHFACITCSAEGSYLVDREKIEKIKAYPVEEVVDATGAGDLYAAGVLYGYIHGFSLKESAELGAFCGSLIVAQIGPRYQFSLQKKAIAAGFRF